MPIVNARMYSVTAEAKADWHRVLGWALRRAGLDWEIVDFDAPAPLAQLWARADLPGAKVVVSDDWESCVRGADIVVEASRLEKPEPKLKTEWIEKGACVIPYGTMSAVELSLIDIMDKIVMDDWGQARSGPYGALRAHVDSGRLSEKNLHAELGQIVAGLKPGRESDGETNLFWHRGLSLSDIALGAAMLAKARRLGIGQRLRFR